MAARRRAPNTLAPGQWFPDYDIIPEPPHSLTLLDPKGARLVHLWILMHTPLEIEEHAEDLPHAEGISLVAIGSRRTARMAKRIDYAVSRWCRGSWRRTWIWFWLAGCENQQVPIRELLHPA